MEDRIYDYWVATLQDGYIGNIIEITDAIGGAKSLYSLFLRNNMGEDIDNILFSVKSKEGKVMFTNKLSRHIAKLWKTEGALEKEYYQMINNNVHYVNHTDKDFPKKLKNIGSVPYGLFVRGSLPNENKKSVAIVGARECSEYGRLCAEYFGDRLSREGVQIISGMAWGIDGLSQMAALKAGGNSYGVLGCGVDVIYPRKNRELYYMLCENGNGLISEYAPKSDAISRMFPPRNRIISGLCDVLLVVEARARSGTLITVGMATEQGKTVMAVPGRVTDELSGGCLRLIKDGAVPAINVEGIMEELNTVKDGFEQLKLNFDSTNTIQDTAFNKQAYKGTNLVKIEGDERLILDCLGVDSTNIEEIANHSGLDISSVLVALSKLDLKGFVKEIAPGEFVPIYRFT